MRSNQIKIDGQALAKILKERGLGVTKVSEEVGYHFSNLGRCIKTNQMSRNMAVGIELRYGIPREKFVIPEEKPEPEQMAIDLVPVEQEKPVDPIDYEKLWKVIYTATYEATKKAWSEL